MTIPLEKFVLKVPPYFYEEAGYNERLSNIIYSKKVPNTITQEDRILKNPLLSNIKVKRSNKIYNMHTYWSKKPYQIIQTFINHYSNREDLILDPFCGSGGTLLAAGLCQRRSIGIDISPAATFFTAALCSQPDLIKFKKQFTEILYKLRRKYSWIYEIPYNSQNRTIHFGISSLQIKCNYCSTLNASYELKNIRDYFCSQCNNKITSNQEKAGYLLHEWHLKAGHGKHIILRPNIDLLQFEFNINQKIIRGGY